MMETCLVTVIIVIFSDARSAETAFHLKHVHNEKSVS